MCEKMLVFIGIGYSFKHLTMEALDYLKKADKVIVDTYTSLYEDDLKGLREYTSAEIVFASRNDLEGESMDKIISEAFRKNIVIAIPGDPFIATTHDSLRLEAVKKDWMLGSSTLSQS